jgi:hypothetical protein
MVDEELTRQPWPAIRNWRCRVASARHALRRSPDEPCPSWTSRRSCSRAMKATFHHTLRRSPDGYVVAGTIGCAQPRGREGHVVAGTVGCVRLGRRRLSRRRDLRLRSPGCGIGTQRWSRPPHGALILKTSYGHGTGHCVVGACAGIRWAKPLAARKQAICAADTTVVSPASGTWSGWASDPCTDSCAVR